MGKIVEQKEYGMLLNYPEYRVNFFDTFGIKKDMVDKKLTYKKETSKNPSIDVDNEIVMKGNNLFIKSVATDRDIEGEHVLFVAEFENGEYLSFTLAEYKNEPYFCDVFHSCLKNGTFEARAYNNGDVVDMQSSVPNHELLRAINMVLEAFSDKGSVEKLASVNDENKQKQ